MIDHTHSLSAIILLGTVTPAELVRGIAYSVAQPGTRAFEERQRLLFRYVMSPVYVGLATATLYLIPQHIQWLAANRWWYVVAITLAPALIGLEIGITAASLLILKKPIRGIKFTTRSSDGLVSQAMSTVLIGGSEEVIFRAVWITVLAKIYSVPLAISVLLAAGVYGLSHSYFGPMTALQKLVSGLAYGVAFVASGYVLLVPVILHISQNLYVIAADKTFR